MLSLGYHLRQSQKPGFVFLEKSFCRFQGVQPAPGSGAACPFLRHSCFRKKAFAVFRGATGARIGCGMSLFEAFVFSESAFPCFGDMPQNGIGMFVVPKSGIRVFGKKLLPKLGHRMAQNGPKWSKTAEIFRRMSLFGPLSFQE